ncbi:TPA: hypothetical protein ACJX9Z_002151, partial [Neisseria gonorrhoeae]
GRLHPANLTESVNFRNSIKYRQTDAVIPIVSPGGRGEMRNGQGGAERAVLCPGFPFSREHISPPAAFALEIV